MFAWQITNPQQISKINIESNLQRTDDVKVKITKCYVSKQDVLSYVGSSKLKYPIMPGRVAVGIITETLGDSNYFNKGDKVFIPAERPCYTCPNCINGEHEKCMNVQYSTTSFEGYLREFAVIPKSSLHVLPANVSETDAIFIHHISIALTIIDRLKLEKGEHVLICGSSILANIVAQLIAYYQSVPILVSADDIFLENASNCGIYYNVLPNKLLEKNITTITGGRACNKVVFLTESDVSFDSISKLFQSNAKVVISGATGLISSKTKLDIDSALSKQLSITFVKSGNNNVLTAINLLAQNVVNLSNFNVKEYKFDYVSTHFENYSKKYLEGNSGAEFLVDLL